MAKYRLRQRAEPNAKLVSAKSHIDTLDLSVTSHTLDLAIPAHKIHEVFNPDSKAARSFVLILQEKSSIVSKSRKIRAVLQKKVSLRAIQAAIGLVGQGTATRPNLKRNGIKTPADSTKAVRDSDAYFRAQYVEAAARRIDATLLSGYNIKTALAREKPNWLLHEQARRNRLQVAVKVQKESESFGNLLGWYLNPMLNNEADCIAANGHNFYADQGTIIGLPGSVHPKCGCVAGPPHEGAAMVNDVLARIMTTKSTTKRASLKPKKRKAFRPERKAS